MAETYKLSKIFYNGAYYEVDKNGGISEQIVPYLSCTDCAMYRPGIVYNKVAVDDVPVDYGISPNDCFQYEDLDDQNFGMYYTGAMLAISEHDIAIVQHSFYPSFTIKLPDDESFTELLKNNDNIFFGILYLSYSSFRGSKWYHHTTPRSFRNMNGKWIIGMTENKQLIRPINIKSMDNVHLSEGDERNKYEVISDDRKVRVFAPNSNLAKGRLGNILKIYVNETVSDILSKCILCKYSGNYDYLTDVRVESLFTYFMLFGNKKGYRTSGWRECRALHNTFTYDDTKYIGRKCQIHFPLLMQYASEISKCFRKESSEETIADIFARAKHSLGSGSYSMPIRFGLFALTYNENNEHDHAVYTPISQLCEASICVNMKKFTDHHGSTINKRNSVVNNIIYTIKLKTRKKYK